MSHWQDFPELLHSLQFDDAPAGGALVIYHHNQLVVNTAIGQALPNMPWHEHTLSVNFSIGKGVIATLIAILVSKGILNYDTPISQLWPQFAQNDKQSISLRDVLTHTAGLFNIASLTKDANELLDWQYMEQKVAAMSIETPNGIETHPYASAYSALVSGWILGHVIEKATTARLQNVLDEYLAKPLDIVGEVLFGVSDNTLSHIAKPVRYFDGTPNTTRRKPTLKPDSPNTLHILNRLAIADLWRQHLDDTPLSTNTINRLYFDTTHMNLINYKNALMPNGRDGLEYHHNTVLQAVIPAANGISTAHALATIYAMHANDGRWQDQTLIDTTTLNTMRQVCVDGLDAVMPANMRWRLGFHRLFSLQNTTNAYGHMGYNGSVAFADPDRKLSFAFIHNFDTTMLNDIRQFVLAETAIKLAK